MATRRHAGMHSYGGYFKEPFKATKRTSIFATRCYQDDINDPRGITRWIKATDYFALRFITRNQLRYFAKRKWVAVTSVKNRLYVCELCPEKITQHLSGLCVQ